MGFQDFDFANPSSPYPPTPEQEARYLRSVKDQEERDLYRLRYLPYVILSKQLEIKVAEASLAAAITRKQELEAKYGKQARSTWALQHIIDAAEKVTDPREAWILIGRMHEAQRVADEKEKRRETDRKRKAAARKTSG